MEIRAREVFLKKLDFVNTSGNVRVARKRGTIRYYRNWLRLEGSPSLYTDEELELLAEFNDWCNRVYRTPVLYKEGFGFDDNVAFLTVTKTEPLNQTYAWVWTKANMRSIVYCMTLAEVLSRFYREKLEAGMWVCWPDFVPFEIATGPDYDDVVLVNGVNRPASPTSFAICAQTKEELEALTELYRRRLDALEQPYFPSISQRTASAM